MKDTGDHASTADMKKYPEVPTAMDDYKDDYLTCTDGKAKSNVAKVRRSMIKEYGK